jgi:hypothetical protein
MHRQCDPIIDLVNEINLKIGLAERLTERSEHVKAHHVYQGILDSTSYLVVNRLSSD